MNVALLLILVLVLFLAPGLFMPLLLVMLILGLLPAFGIATLAGG